MPFTRQTGSDGNDVTRLNVESNLKTILRNRKHGTRHNCGRQALAVHDVNSKLKLSIMIHAPPGVQVNILWFGPLI